MEPIGGGTLTNNKLDYVHPSCLKKNWKEEEDALCKK